MVTELDLPTTGAADYEEYHRLGRTAEFDDPFEQLRMLSIRAILRQHPALRSARRILDVGCGEGRYLPVWREAFPEASLWALEYSRVAAARSAARHPFVAHITGSGEAIPLRSGSVDGVVSIEVIEHVPDDRRMLAECHRLLVPGGWALISTPCGNTGSLEWTVNFATGNVAPREGMGVLFKKTEDPTHLHRYRSREFAQLAVEAGFAVRDVYFNAHGFVTLAYYLHWMVSRRINLRRRSRRVADAFDAFVRGLGRLDWALLRRIPNASSMVFLLDRVGPAGEVS